MEFFGTFGVSWQKAAIQSAVFLLPAIWATIRVARHRTGAALPLWLLLVWLVPLAGPVLALVLVKEPRRDAGN